MTNLHRRTLATALVALVALLAAAAIALAGGHRPPATLTLKSHSPLTVVGHHFSAHRAVRVTVSTSATQSRRVTPSASGSFTVTFTTVLDRCSGWTVTASQPGRAPVRIHGPKPQCAPAGTP